MIETTDREELVAPRPAETVTMATARTVKPGCEEAFEAALHRFVERTVTEPGQLGVQVVRPEPGSGIRTYGVFRQFANDAARRAFYRSPTYAAWQREVSDLVDGDPAREQLSGLETWFTLPGRRSMVPPPRWKMFCVTLLGVYPASVLLALTLAPAVSGWHLAWRCLANSIVIVAALTWVIMPTLNRWLRAWLHPGG